VPHKVTGVGVLRFELMDYKIVNDLGLPMADKLIKNFPQYINRIKCELSTFMTDN
jgi:hypothetical protein